MTKKAYMLLPLATHSFIIFKSVRGGFVKKQIWTSKTGVHYNIITNPFIHCFLCIRSTTFWWLPSREPKGNKLVCATCWHFAFRITECTFSSYKFSLDQCFWLWDAVVPSCPVTKIGTSVLTSEFFNYLIIR